VKQRMLFTALAVLALSAPAAAEPMRLAQGGTPQVLPPHEVETIVRSTGFDPLDRPIRRGPNYVMHAVDEQDREVTLLINGRSGRIISATPFTTASRMPSRGGMSAEPYEQMPPGYIPPPGARGGYSPGAPIIEDEDDDLPPGYGPRPPAPVPGALPRSGSAARPPAAGAVPPDDRDGPGQSGPRVITSAEPNQGRDESGVLPPPPERFPQRAVTPAAKPKPPVKRAAAAPKQAPLPKPKPQAKVEAAPPPPDTEKAPPPPVVPEIKPADPVPN